MGYGDIVLRLLAIAAIIIAWSGFAKAASAPTVTAPAGAVVLPTGTTLSGITFAEVGAVATTRYTVTFKTAGGGILTATGTGVSGSGTTTLTISSVTAAQLATAVATLKLTWPTAVLQAADTLTISASTNDGGAAAPAQMLISVDGTKYLVFATLAAAQARSQQQCQALGCDGVQTVFWWSVIPLTGGGGAIQIRPGDPCFDKIYAVGCGHAGSGAGTGMTTTEQSALAPATSVALPLPKSPLQ